MMKPDWKLKQTEPLFARIRAVPGVRISKHLIIVELIFLVYILSTLLSEQTFASFLAIGAYLAGKSLKADTDVLLLMQLFLTVICIILTFLCCRFIENRPAGTMLLTRKKLLRDYLGGALLGMAMMTCVVLAAWKFGALQFEGLQPGRRPVMMILLFIGWIIQGFSEELTFRGFLMTSAGTHHSVWAAVLISAVNFAAMHFFNDGFSVFAACNLILFGILTALWVLRTGSLWGAAAMHSIWNWAQGNFFGMQVSGIVTDSTVLRFSQTGSANWIGGSTFGLEAGAATTVVLLLGTLILLCLPGRDTAEAAAADTER